jgi:23S rRNA (cytidine1920-2'-O)/16S rRNA (cytidine1409-2'-O)-methyltransferase
MAANRTRAQALILAGRVLVDGVPVDKAGVRIREDSELRLRGEPPRFVSRGGDKLEGALEDLAIEVRGLRCLDVGASTGGFCDCLLQRGAISIVAVDVGRGQLHEKLRQDPRVRAIHANARDLSADQVPEPVDLVVIDVSFISARRVLPAVVAVAGDARILVMVKPQFEVGRDKVGKGGVVRDDALRKLAVDEVGSFAAGLGYFEVARAESRLAGPKGNREVFLLLARRNRECA